MNKNMHQKYMFILLLPFLFFSMPSLAAKPPPCYYEMENNFLNSYYLLEAFSLNRIVYHGAWTGLVKLIQENIKLIPSKVRMRAEKLHPNPFETPFHPKEAGEVFEAVIIEILTMALGQYDVTNPAQVRNVFDFIKEQQKNKWDECFGEEEITHTKRR